MRDASNKGRLRFGIDHPKAKLTEAQIVLIRTDNRKLREIAAEYKVTHGLISSIKRREIWKHVQ
jgi:hypothetical protein